MQPGIEEYRYLRLLIKEQSMLPVNVKDAVYRLSNKECLMPPVIKEYDNHRIPRKEQQMKLRKKASREL